MRERKNETRRDFLGRKVIITANRAKRPQEFAAEKKRKRVVLPERCFFCPGNEHLTPPEIDRIEYEAGKWQVRCFPNKFYAVSKEFKRAYGSHEVIVETDDHYKTLSELSPENILNVLEMYKRRINAAKEDRKIEYALVFKNEGKEAGASLEHTHTQFISLSFIPPLVKEEMKKARKGKCAFCSMLEKEKEREIFSNAHFFAFEPSASRFHFETWILSKRHVGCITRMSPEELRALAETLKAVLGKLDALLNFPPYNYVVHIAPFKNPDFHFHIEILPRLSIWAGFEYGAGVVLNSMVPEQAAEELRKI